VLRRRLILYVRVIARSLVCLPNRELEYYTLLFKIVLRAEFEVKSESHVYSSARTKRLVVARRTYTTRTP
jgi:hypothetical protein